MSRQIGPALQHLARRRPIRPFAFHRHGLCTGPGKSLAANPDAIFDRSPAPQNIVETSFTRRDNDRARLLAAVPGNDLARNGLRAKYIEKVGERPAIERIKGRVLEEA